MFKSVEEALEVFAGLAEDTVIAAIVAFLMPVTVLSPITPVDADPPVLSFVGGAPVWSSGLTWPDPPVYEDIEDLALRRGGELFAPQIRKAAARSLPHAFVGQIDLSTLQVPDFPTTGRLLFFYDIAIGPWDTGKRTAHVIWDQAPPEDLIEAPIPASLLAAEAEEKALTEKLTEVTEADRLRFPGMSDAEIKKQIADEEGPFEFPERFFIGPKQTLGPKEVLQLPSPRSLEWESFVERVSKGAETQQTSARLEGVFYDAELKRQNRATAQQPALRGDFQVGGLPLADRGDPRDFAAIYLVLGEQNLEIGQWERHKEEIVEVQNSLQLLFQVWVPAWLDQDGDGMVYFLIQKDDLKARKFENVVAVHINLYAN